MEDENRKFQTEPSEGDRGTVERELKRQDEKSGNDKAAEKHQPGAPAKPD